MKQLIYLLLIAVLLVPGGAAQSDSSPVGWIGWDSPFQFVGNLLDKVAVATGLKEKETDEEQAERDKVQNGEKDSDDSVSEEDSPADNLSKKVNNSAANLNEPKTSDTDSVTTDAEEENIGEKEEEGIGPPPTPDDIRDN